MSNCVPFGLRLDALGLPLNAFWGSALGSVSHFGAGPREALPREYSMLVYPYIHMYIYIYIYVTLYTYTAGLA